ncbi:MAG: TonB-dependent receptor plug domain-containing protein [Chitinophagaceae bacterium]
MISVLPYLLKLSISLAVVYLFYWLVLRRLTFYNWNRWYLVIYTMLSFFIPFINIYPLLQKNNWSSHEVLEYIPNVGSEQILMRGNDIKIVWTYREWTLLLVGVGIGVMLLRLIIQQLSFLKIRRSAKLIIDDTIKVYQVDQDIIPFSYGNSIFVNKYQHTEEELKEIIRHEFIHVKQKHTLDILWCEWLCIINWYNPFAWMLRQAVRQNLEFIADNKVLANGIDKKEYQYLLLKVIGVAHFSIAPQFNFSSLKKRIAMMNKMKSAKLHLIKFLFILPFVVVLLVSFRNKFVFENTSNRPSIKYEGIVFDMDTHQPLANVSVTDQLSGKTSVSNGKGRFSFEFEKNSKGLSVFMVFNKKGYKKSEAPFAIYFKKDLDKSTGLMELTTMKKGADTDQCYDCLSSMSMLHEDTPEKINDEALIKLYNERIKDNSISAVIVPYSDWKFEGIRFESDEKIKVNSDDNGFMMIDGIRGISLTEQSPKGLILYRNHEYTVHDFMEQHPFLRFNKAYVYQGQIAFDKFGNKGRNGVMYVVDPVLQDTIPTPSIAPVKVKDTGMVRGVKSISIANGIASVKLANGTKERYDLNKVEEKEAYLKKYGELPSPPPPPSANAPVAPSLENSPVSPPSSPAPPVGPSPVSPPPPPKPPIKNKYNGKGYVITVADNQGECIVIVKNKAAKIVRAMALTDWNRNESENIATYGEIPSPVKDSEKADVNPKTVPGVKTQSGAFNLEVEVQGYKLNGSEKWNSISHNQDLLYVIDGIQQSKGADAIKQLDPNDIESISILKDESAIALYGVKGSKGVVLITSKKKKGEINFESNSLNRDKDKTVLNGNVKLSNLDNFSGLIVVDGKEYTKKEFMELSLESINIESVTVLKGVSATTLYGDKGKEGVIEIKTKKPLTSFHQKNNSFIISAKKLSYKARTNTLLFEGDLLMEDNTTSTISGKAVRLDASNSLLMVDGYQKSLKEDFVINNKKYRIVSLPKKESMEKYGAKGENGALEITSL